MENKDTLQEIESKKMKPVDFIYLGIILLFFIITAIMFFFSTSFIIGHINKIFLPVDEGTNKPLEMERYKLIEKKLNLPINTSDGKTIVNTPVETTTAQNVVTQDINTKMIVTPHSFDKKSITINILNGVRKAGVASLLSNNLEKAGFSKSVTGDNSTIESVTTIYIKDSKKEYIPFIKAAVKKLYPKAVTKINPESSNFDIIIIIGK